MQISSDAAAYLLECSVTEDMAAAGDGYKWIASAVKLRHGADESLHHLCICGCGLLPNQVRLFCQMYSEHVPAVQRGRNKASTS